MRRGDTRVRGEAADVKAAAREARARRRARKAPSVGERCRAEGLAQRLEELRRRSRAYAEGGPCTREEREWILAEEQAVAQELARAYLVARDGPAKASVWDAVTMRLRGTGAHVPALVLAPFYCVVAREELRRLPPGEAVGGRAAGALQALVDLGLGGTRVKCPCASGAVEVVEVEDLLDRAARVEHEQGARSAWNDRLVERAWRTTGRGGAGAVLEPRTRYQLRAVLRSVGLDAEKAGGPLAEPHRRWLEQRLCALERGALGPSVGVSGARPDRGHLGRAGRVCGGPVGAPEDASCVRHGEEERRPVARAPALAAPSIGAPSIDAASEPEVIDARRAAAILGVRPKTVYDWARKGVIPVVRYDGSSAIRFDTACLRAYRASQTRSSAPMPAPAINRRGLRRRGG